MLLYALILLLIGASAYMLSSSLIQIEGRQRLRYLEPLMNKGKFDTSFIKKIKPVVRFLRPISDLPYIKRLQAQADTLKIFLDVELLVLAKALLGVVSGILVYVVFKELSYGFLAVLIGFFTPDFIFVSKMRAKKEEIVRVFPETIDLIDLCIGAGLDFPSSIKWVIDKSDPNPFIEQLAIVLREIQVGRNRTEALKDMAKRLQITDIGSFVRTVVQSERMGTSVEEGFRNLSEDTRNSRFQQGERFAIKASLKILFPLLFCILPVILIVVAGPIIIKFTQGELIPKAGAGF